MHVLVVLFHVSFLALLFANEFERSHSWQLTAPQINWLPTRHEDSEEHRPQEREGRRRRGIHNYFCNNNCHCSSVCRALLINSELDDRSCHSSVMVDDRDCIYDDYLCAC